MSAFFLSDIGNANGVPQAESNSAIIGGVQHFYVDTKPIERPNGDPLVIGDRWWKTDDGTEWFWNGTYWLSSNDFIQTAGNTDGSPNTITASSYQNLSLVFLSNSDFFSPQVGNAGIFFTSWTANVFGRSPGLDNINYWQFFPNIGNGIAANALIEAKGIGGGAFTYTSSINMANQNYFNPQIRVEIYAQAFGNVDCAIICCLRFKLIHP